MAITTATAIALAGLTVGVGSAVASTRAQKMQAAAQQRAQQVQVRRQRRAAIRSNRLATARAQATAAGTGTADSSGLSGGLGGAASNLFSGLGTGTQLSAISGQISKYGLQASQYQALGGLGMQAFQFGMNQGAFKKPTSTQTGTVPADPNSLY